MDLSRALERWQLEPFDGVVHRIYDPQYGFLETIGSYLNGGRWNRKNLYGALYTSLEKGTAIAEARRAAARSNLLLRDFGPRAHVVVKVKLSRVMSLALPRFYSAIGITRMEVLDNQELCLRIADGARRLGCEGLLVPSVAASGMNLVVYQDKLLEGWKFEEVSRENDLRLG